MLRHTASVGESHYGQGSNLSFDGERPAKRPKVAIACNVCKSRKSKCDGARPVCSPCARRSGRQHKCVYRDAANLEAVQLHSSPTDQARSYFGSPPQVRTEDSSIIARPAIDALRNVPNFRSESSAESNVSSCDPSPDAMGLVDNWALRVGFLGSSSKANFVQHIEDVADGAEPYSQRLSESISNHVSPDLRNLGKARTPQNVAHVAEFVLPVRKTADYLLKIYWEHSHSVFPFLDKFEFEKSYSLLWTGADSISSDEQLFHCILNLMFAISCKLDPNAGSKDQSKSADVYFKRAEPLLKSDLLDIDRFPLIQALLLMAQYLESTNMPRHCFRSLGLAIWIAQDIGLHIPKTISSLTDLREQELAKRIWHSCILLDRVVAMVFGRPVKIPQAVAALAPPLKLVDDEFFETASASTSSQPAKVDFFVQYCKLHYILADILPVLYGFPTQESMIREAEPKRRLFTVDLQSTFDSDEKLELWKNTLPNHLQISSHVKNQTSILIFHRQANMLHLRYLHVRLMMLRISFTRGTYLLGRSSENEPLTSQMKSIVVSRSLYLCVKTAEQIIGFIHTRVFDKNQQEILPPCWYNVTYIYTAATAIIAAYCFLKHIEGITAPMLDISLQNSYELLSHYEKTTISASRCKSALQSTYGKVVLAEGRNLADQEMTTSDRRILLDPPFSINSTSMPALDENGYMLPIIDDQDMDWINYATNNWDFSLWQ